MSTRLMSLIIAPFQPAGLQLHGVPHIIKMSAGIPHDGDFVRLASQEAQGPHLLSSGRQGSDSVR